MSDWPARYFPKPIDTNHVHLDAQFHALVERLAENFHEVWAQSRIADGWRYGHNRDDSKKIHPCLLPFCEMDEAERCFDRIAAREFVRAILALGYRIKPPVGPTGDPDRMGS